jgi:hypothetical protein
MTLANSTLQLSSIQILTSDSGKMMDFLTHMFELEIQIQDKELSANCDYVTINGIKFEIVEMKGYKTPKCLGSAFQISVEHLSDLEAYKQKHSFYFYRNELNQNTQEVTSFKNYSYLDIADPDKRIWRVICHQKKTKLLSAPKSEHLFN